MFAGSCVALVTPMTAQGSLDERGLIDLVNWHIEAGTAAIVIAGSTGEGATLTANEHQQALALVIKTANKRIPVIAGTGTNSTQTTIEKTQQAQALGADACLIVTPYYNKPTQHGLLAHFSAVAQAVNLPILLYNVPSRTGCDMSNDTVATLSKIPNIVGVKEATGDLTRLQALQAKCRQGFHFYSGDDPTALDFIQQGGHGVISITANVAPNQMQKMCHFALTRQHDKALSMDKTLQNLHRLMMVESNPIPVKWALHYLGKIENAIRLPLTPLSLEHHDKIKNALQSAGILAQQTHF